MPLHLKPVDFKIADAQAYEVRNGVTFLALITFDGPNESLRTHAGDLHDWEHRRVNAEYQAQRARERFQQLLERDKEHHGR